MTKRELIEEITVLNPTAPPAFLARFDDGDLAEYLRHLRWVGLPRVTTGLARWEASRCLTASLTGRSEEPGDMPDAGQAGPAPPDAEPARSERRPASDRMDDLMTQAAPADPGADIDSADPTAEAAAENEPSGTADAPESDDPGAPGPLPVGAPASRDDRSPNDSSFAEDSGGDHAQSWMY